MLKTKLDNKYSKQQLKLSLVLGIDLYTPFYNSVMSSIYFDDSDRNTLKRMFFSDADN